MECPRCRADLVAQSSTWRCPEGHGRFVPAEALGPTADRRVSKADATFPSIQCPSCRQAMELRHPKGVDIDVCACGSVWLDAGEEKILRERQGNVVLGVAERIGWLALGAGGFG